MSEQASREQVRRDYVILNVRGLAIGRASATNPQAAVAAWNKANVSSNEVATDAYAPKAK